MGNIEIPYILAIIVALAAFTRCATTRVKPSRSQLQIREMQTRSLDTPDVEAVVKAIVNVLQDDGYVTKQVNPELGFINATKEYEEGLKLSELINPFISYKAMSIRDSDPTWTRRLWNEGILTSTADNAHLSPVV